MEDDLLSAVDFLADQYLGRHGIVTISDGAVNNETVILVYVQGDTDEAMQILPREIRGIRIVIEKSGPVVAFSNAQDPKGPSF